MRLDELTGIKAISNDTITAFLAKLIRDRKIKVRQGSYAFVVIVQDRDYVYKVWTNDTAWEQYMNYAYQHQSNPHVIKIQGKVRKIPFTFKRPENFDATFNVVKLEKLEEMPINHSALWVEMNAMCDVISAEMTVDDVKHATAIALEDDIKNVTIPDSFIETALDLLQNSYVKDDLSTTNIMMRGDVPVIVDPYSMKGAMSVTASDIVDGNFTRRHTPSSETKSGRSRVTESPKDDKTLQNMLTTSIAKAKGANDFKAKVKDAVGGVQDAFREQARLEKWMADALIHAEAIPNKALAKYKSELQPLIDEYQPGTDYLSLLYFHASNKDPHRTYRDDGEPNLQDVADAFLHRHLEDVKDALTSVQSELKKIAERAKAQKWPTGDGSWSLGNITKYPYVKSHFDGIAEYLKHWFAKRTDEAFRDISRYVDDFEREAGDKMADWFGTGTFKDACTEPGNCAMVSDRFVDWLKERGVEARLLTGHHAVNPDWAKRVKVRPGGDEDAHTVVYTQGAVVDWTARQFDPKAPFPRVIPLVRFRSEWKRFGSTR